MKVEDEKLGGLFQYIRISTLKWEDLNNDFIVGLSHTPPQHDSSWGVVDQMIK